MGKSVDFVSVSWRVQIQIEKFVSADYLCHCLNGARVIHCMRKSKFVCSILVFIDKWFAVCVYFIFGPTTPRHGAGQLPWYVMTTNWSQGHCAELDSEVTSKLEISYSEHLNAIKMTCFFCSPLLSHQCLYITTTLSFYKLELISSLLHPRLQSVLCAALRMSHMLL